MGAGATIVLQLDILSETSIFSYFGKHVISNGSVKRFRCTITFNESSLLSRLMSVSVTYSRCNSRRIKSPIASVGGTPSNITLCAVSVIGISTPSCRAIRNVARVVGTPSAV